MEIVQADVVLCEFYFSDLRKSKNRPVLVLKDNLPYNDFVAIPKYDSYRCNFIGLSKAVKQMSLQKIKSSGLSPRP